MKRLIGIVLCIFLCISMFSYPYTAEEIKELKEELVKNDKLQRLRITDPVSSIFKGDDYVIIRAGYDETMLKLNLDEIQIDSNGFAYFDYLDKRHLCIYGDGYFFIFDYNDSSKFQFYLGNTESDALFAFTRAVQLDEFYYLSPMNKEIIHSFNKNDLESYKQQINKFSPSVARLYNFYIKAIKSSSYYTEILRNGTQTNYVSTYLNLLLLADYYCDDWLAKEPWVPGKEKNESGIGEYLTIEFTEPKDNLVVLNGYVDLFKRYLYKANNRVKTAIITSLDENNPFEFEYIFEDYVHFAEINFPSAVDKVKFTIKEVYKGEKWDDTCITAVITKYENE